MGLKITVSSMQIPRNVTLDVIWAANIDVDVVINFLKVRGPMYRTCCSLLLTSIT